MAIDITSISPARSGTAVSTARAPEDGEGAVAQPPPATPENDSAKGENRPAAEVDPARLAKTVERANRLMEATAHDPRSLRFEIHEQTDRQVVKVFDDKTDELIKQFPPEDFLETASRLVELRAMLLDRMA